jgi:CzcA family heavy metal efflux pump
MIVSDTAVNRSTTVFTILVLVMISGVFSYSYLPREADPEIVVPIITISTSYAGVAPTDVETLVTTPIERKLTGLKGVKEITSSSNEGFSSITIEFEPDINIDDALQRVGDKVNLATGDLPQDAKKPVIREVNMAELPIMYLALSGGNNLADLTEIAESLEDRIEAIPGVQDVGIIGSVEREIQVEVDPVRLAQYGISLPTLTNLLLKENVNTPAGTMDLGSAKYITRVPGEFRSPEELAGLIAKPGIGKAVYLRNVASVRDGYKDIQTISRVNDIPSVTLTIAKRSGENIIAISERVNTLINQVRSELPDGINVVVTMDKSIEIRDMVLQLESGILTGLILVLVVIFLFMGLTNAVFVSMAIPVSLLIAFTALAILDITLNMVVLFSLTLCLGMLVDNAIVVVENIYRYRQKGLSAKKAAKEGAGEVAVPIIASTITTLAAFMPLFFWPGVMGSYMEFLPKTVTLTLLASLFVGLVINPAVVSAFMSRRKKTIAPAGERRSVILDAYARVLKSALRWRAATVVFSMTILVMVVVIFFTKAEIEFMPQTEPYRADINIDAPEGTNLNASDELARQVEDVARKYMDDIEFVVTKVGSSGGRRGGSTTATHSSQVTLRFPQEFNETMMPTDILNRLRGELQNVVGAEIRFSQEGYGPPKSSAVSIELNGDDFEMLAMLSKEVRSAIRDIEGLTDLDDDLERGRPEIRVTVNREEAWLAGMDTQAIGLSVKAAIEGIQAGRYREGDEEYDVTVQFPREFKEDLAYIESMTLVNSTGEAIPFSTVASVEQGVGMGSIRHINRKRTITVLGRAEGRSSTEVVADAKAILADFNLPNGYTLTFTGENKDRNDTQGFLIIAFFIGLILITLVLIAQFNSIIQPLIIMSSVILSLAGVFLGLLLFDLPFGIFMTGLGCISLAGVVVNNAIVLIDFINREREQGVSVEDAVLHAGKIRFRPVTLTAITTILGLIPMAIGISFDFRSFSWLIGGTSSQFWGSMAIAIIFGLTFATILTLVVVPVLYSASHSASLRLNHLLGKPARRPISSS